MAFHDELVSRLPVPLAADYRGVDVKRDRLDRDRFESAWYKLLAVAAYRTTPTFEAWEALFVGLQRQRYLCRVHLALPPVQHLLDPSRADAPLARLPSHNSGKIAVTALAFSPDARVLSSGLFDGSITAWDVAGRRRLGDIHTVRGEVTDLSYAHDGSAVTAVTDRGVVLRWNLDPGDWVTMACAIANRDVSTEERARFLEGGGLAAICP